MQSALVDRVVDEILLPLSGKVEVFIDELRDWCMVVDVCVDQ